MMKKLLCLMALFAVFLMQAQNVTITGLGNTIVDNGSNVPDASDDTDFGSVNIGGTAVTHTFTITNNLFSAVIINDNGLTGATTDFSRSSGGSANVNRFIAGFSSVTFEVTFDPVSPIGTKSVTLDLTATVVGLGSPSSHIINFEGNALAPATTPTIELSGLGVPIANFDFSPSVLDDTEFGNVMVGSSETHTFTISNNGTAPLNLTGAPVVDLPGGAGTFTVTSFPTTPIPAGSSSTFDVEFSPPVTPIDTYYTASVSIPNDDPANSSFFYLVAGTGVATAPEIEVSGLGTPIANLDFSASVTDDTEYGNVAVASSETHTFTISNTGTAPLNLTGTPLVDVLGGGEFVVSNFPTTPIPVSGTTTFDVTFSPTSSGYQSATIQIDSDDATDLNFFFLVQGTGIVPGPEMDITGLGNPINNGDLTTSVANDTDYGSVDVSTGSATHTFTIENNGTLDLTLTDPSPYVTISGVDAADFTLVTIPSSPIAAAGSTTFNIIFDPTGVALTTRTATVSIANDDVDENPYTFTISGTAIDANVGSPLMITQYYEGSGNDQWIEVKNISTSIVTAGAYNLALYTNTGTREGVINVNAPVASVGISGALGAIQPGEVILFKNNVGTPILPGAANLGSAHVISTAACNFTGNDVILISTSTGVNCYNDRTDIIGEVPPPAGFPSQWGENISLIKGCGTTQQPSLVFDESNYIELFLDEVDTADPDSNIALGTQLLGSTVWTTSWSNGTPGRTRNAIISGTYNASDGSFGACDLNVTGTLNFNGGTSNYVEVNDNLTISGSFTIGDQESLYTVNVLDPGGDPVSISGNITKLETTTSLNDSDDYTYWSSPVENANMSTVFAAPLYQQTRLYYWDQSAPNLIPAGGSEALGEWISATGLTMRQAKGYISQSPQGVAYPTQATVSFTGTPHNGTIDLDASGNDVVFNNNGNPNDDLNLVGNPYPSAIDADEFIIDGNNAVSINGTIWFWTHNTPNNQNATGEQYENDDYASYNLLGSLSGAAANTGGVVPNGIIGSGQGFMVQTNSDIQKVSFTDGMRLKGQNTQFFRGVDTKSAKTDEKDRIWLNVESSKGGAFSEILIGFVENATDGFDRAYDGIKISEGYINLYSKIDTLKYGIQGLSSFSIDKKVHLAFDTYIEETDVTYSISIDRFEGASLSDNDIYLVDNELNVTHDLKQGAYDFSAATGSYDDRFILQFTKATLGVDELDLNNDFVVVNEDNALLVKSKNVVTELKMYDVTGRLLKNMLPNESEFRIDTNSIRKGTVLILNTTFENGTEISKKAIKY